MRGKNFKQNSFYNFELFITVTCCDLSEYYKKKKMMIFLSKYSTLIIFKEILTIQTHRFFYYHLEISDKMYYTETPFENVFFFFVFFSRNAICHYSQM